MKKFFSKHRAIKIAGLALVALLLAGITAFLIFASDVYHPDEVALLALEADNVEIFEDEGVIAVHAQQQSDTAIMFYPGGQVEYEAYVPLLQKMQETLGLTCVMVEMPLNMAILSPSSGDKILELFPDIESWYLCGHSIGGVTGSMYAYDNMDIIDALIVLGSYNYSDYPEEKTLTIYGSFNDNLEQSIDYTQNIHVIEGGNHAQFGNYGKQKIDVDATITTQAQQDATVEIMQEFLAQLDTK